MGIFNKQKDTDLIAQGYSLALQHIKDEVVKVVQQSFDQTEVQAALRVGQKIEGLVHKGNEVISTITGKTADVTPPVTDLGPNSLQPSASPDQK